MSEIQTIYSILHIAGSGFRLSLLLNAVGCEVASAGIDVHSIAKGLSLYVMSLKRVGQSFQAPDTLHSPEALSTAREISEQSRDIFDDFEIMLENVQRDGGGSVQERFKRCFRKQHVTYLLAHLEALKLSLMVMHQILQLAKLTSARRNTPYSVRDDTIRQERAEIQNMVIVRYWSINRLDRLYDLAAREATEYGQNGNTQSNGTSSQQQSTNLTKLPVISLGNLDNSLAPIKESPKDMVRVSSKVIDPLVTRWTRSDGYWELAAEQTGSQRHVSFESESDGDDDVYSDSSERPGTHGYYLEGTTTDWRQPHSQEARKRASELRKEYSGLQARVDSETDGSSDSESNRPRRRNFSTAPSGNSSAPEAGAHRRGDSGYVSSDKARRRASPSRPRISTPETNAYTHEHDGQLKSNSPRTVPRSIPQRQPQPYSYTANLPPHDHPRSFSSTPSQPHLFNQHPTSHPVTLPSSYPPPANPRPHPQRDPASHKGRSHRQYPPVNRSSSNNNTAGQTRRDYSTRDENAERRRNLKRSATTGILGAGAIAGFLEALEGLSI
ncbi:hypothetical protein AJ79_00815 [Helicocarpus griseus UAMH5409]|uniref:Fungal N-terminal domain-containing protein n=1 Tax=Helicocarpus griseus UAMH5409 TaxID=1447875 RepID=A0A2B7Y8T0_9EURO|nr:hypothetical protein AJ79_00815 [Helicocarpus griseus UAMH5409]